MPTQAPRVERASFRPWTPATAGVANHSGALAKSAAASGAAWRQCLAPGPQPTPEALIHRHSTASERHEQFQASLHATPRPLGASQSARRSARAPPPALGGGSRSSTPRARRAAALALLEAEMGRGAGMSEDDIRCERGAISVGIKSAHVMNRRW